MSFLLLKTHTVKNADLPSSGFSALLPPTLHKKKCIVALKPFLFQLLSCHSQPIQRKTYEFIDFPGGSRGTRRPQDTTPWRRRTSH